MVITNNESQLRNDEANETNETHWYQSDTTSLRSQSKRNSPENFVSRSTHKSQTNTNFARTKRTGKCVSPRSSHDHSDMNELDHTTVKSQRIDTNHLTTTVAETRECPSLVSHTRAVVSAHSHTVSYPHHSHSHSRSRTTHTTPTHEGESLTIGKFAESHGWQHGYPYTTHTHPPVVPHYTVGTQ